MSTPVPPGYPPYGPPPPPPPPLPPLPPMPATGPSTTDPDPGARRPGTVSYLPALDGIRAIAIAGVLLYHGGVTAMRGGFLGVDTFFVLSGFLITTLLLVERAASGTVRLRRFWAHRARRLLPALLAVLVAVSLYVHLGGLSEVYPQLPSDSVATLLYSANWHFIATQTNYFAVSGHASPLLHTWSLAIEEQFYILWPLIVVGITFLARRRRAHGALPGAGASVTQRYRARLTLLFVLCVAGAGASAWWMARLYRGGVGITRAYYGTDSRAQSLLIGAALAVGLMLWGRRAQEGPARTPESGHWAVARTPHRAVVRRVAIQTVGVAGLGVTLWCFTHVGETDALAFHGGFAVAGLGGAGIIAASTLAPQGLLARALSVPPLVYVGRISYGVYLWHWPVIVFVDHSATGLSGLSLLGVRIAFSVAAAALSYHAIESPIRRHAWHPLPAAAALAGAVVVTVSAVLVGAPMTPANAVSIFRSHTTVAAPPVSASAVQARATQQQLQSFYRNISALQASTKVLLLGDSMPFTLGQGMNNVAPAEGIWLSDLGIASCSVTVDNLFEIEGNFVEPSSACAVDPTSDMNWRSLWTQWVDSFNPDVVVYLARLDIVTQKQDNVFEHIGSETFDALLQARLEEGISIMSSKGASVVLMTSPYYDSGEQTNGNPWPEDDPSRVDAYNAMIARVAAKFPNTVTLVDLGAMISPGGHFSTSVSGVIVRSPDGVHFTIAGGEWIGDKILPQLYQLGRIHHSLSPGGSWPQPPPPSN